jgi:hypothetical protein
MFAVTKKFSQKIVERQLESVAFFAEKESFKLVFEVKNKANRSLSGAEAADCEFLHSVRYPEIIFNRQVPNWV